MKSTEIGEKINAVEWINNNESALRVVSANDKVIKLWKISYKKQKKFESAKSLLKHKGQIQVPRSKVLSEGWEAEVKREFVAGHI